MAAKCTEIMERADDKRRYFIFSSAISEVVIPILRNELRNCYKEQEFKDFQEFLDDQTIRHFLFHLRYNSAHCCTDRQQCNNQLSLPLLDDQWNLLYTAKANPSCGNQCHCKYAANDVNLKDIDLTLASSLLIKLCILRGNESQAVENLRHFINDHLGQNMDGCIPEDEFDALWRDLKKNILMLHPYSKDELIWILQRPMNAQLYEKYRDDMIGIHKKLQEMLEQEQTSKIMNRTPDDNTVTNRQPYRLGQDVFSPQFTKIDPWSLPGVKTGKRTSDILMTDDGRIVMCLDDINTLLICNSDGSAANTIPVEDTPGTAIAISDSTLAVIIGYETVVMYDINRKIKIRTIPVPDHESCADITTINNTLVVAGGKKIWMIDLQTEDPPEVIKTIETKIDEVNLRLHTSGDRFFSFYDSSFYLTCYHQSGEICYTSIPFPSFINGITSLQDGSLYVVCDNYKVYHLSSDGQNYESVQTDGLKGWLLKFNKTQQKLSLYHKGKIQIFHLLNTFCDNM